MGIAVLNAEAIQAIVKYAEQPKNWYYPDRDPKPPGDRPNHYLDVGTYSCVFSHAIIEGKRWKYLSVRCAHPHSVPSPVMLRELANAFGLSNPLMGLNEEEGTAVAAECLEEVQ